MMRGVSTFLPSSSRMIIREIAREGEREREEFEIQ